MWKKKGIFRRFLMSYVCVLIPMLILNLWMVNALRSDRAEQVRAQMRTRLEYAGIRLDEQINRYRKSAVMLASDTKLLRYKMLGSVQNAREGIERLGEVVGYNPELREVFMVYDEYRIYSNEGMTRASAHFSQRLGLEDAIAAEAHNAVQSDEIRILRLAVKNEKNAWYLFHYPVRVYKNGVTVSVNFVLQEAELFRVVETTVADETACLGLAPAGREGALYSCQTGKNVLQAPDEYGLESVSGAYFDLAVYYDENLLRAEEARHWLVWYAAVALMMLLLVLLSFYLSRRHYRPIARLVDRARDASSVPMDAPPGENEYDYIGEMILHMARQGQNLSRKLDEEQRLLRQQSATLIFNGLVRDRRDILSRLDFSGVSLETDNFAVLAVAAESAEALSGVRRRASALLQYETEENGRYVLLALTGLHSEDRDGAERLARAKALVGEEELCVSVSGVWDDPEHISQARMEAMRALGSAQVGGPVAMPKETGTERALQMADALTRAISARDSDCAVELLRQLHALCFNARDEIRTLESVQRAIVSAAIAVGEEEETDATEALLASLPQQISGQGGDSWAVLENVVREFCVRDDHSDIVAAALDYIRQNFTCNDLSLDAVAEHCQVSSAYLSRLFKRRMGIGYIDYVTDLRMTEARSLLQATTLPVAEIALRVGYLNVSSFRKKFKLATGMSLSEYRQDNRKEEETWENSR